MRIDELKKKNLVEIKFHYIEWLNSQNLSANTVSTAKVDAFYILKHNASFDFWGMIESDEFENTAKAVLKETLAKHSKGNVQGNLGGYLAHLRRFRRFVYEDANAELQAKLTQEKPKRKLEKRKQELFIPTPRGIEVEKYLKRWETMEHYALQEQAIDKLFLELVPFNEDLRDILMKAATLNDFYSTNIFSVYPVAKHIQSLHIDKRLDDADETLVKDLQTVTIKDKTMNFYSFATKYCSHHRPLEYPIYDSYVDEVIRYFRDKDEFMLFANKDLKDFPKFKSILKQFRAYYQLESYTLKQLDQYIWQLGKLYFPKNYKVKGKN